MRADGNMTPHPLTHHEILGLVEPYVRRGRHVNLAASDRLERRLVFKAYQHAGETPATPALHETLQLECLETERFRLTRVLSLACGIEACLQCEGAQPGELLARIEAVAPRRQFEAGPGFVIAKSYRLEAPGDAAPDIQQPVRMTLTEGVAVAEGLTLTLTVPTVRRTSAEIELHAAAGDEIEPPDDLLAVLGWRWGRLRHVQDGWRSTLRLRGRGLDLGADAEIELARAAAHLARTFSEPPARFHERLVAARWWVVLRRVTPLLACIGLVAAAASVPKLGLAQDSAARMLIFNAPPVLMVLFFCMRELPRIEIPRFPRAATLSSWRRAAAQPTGEPLMPDARR